MARGAIILLLTLAAWGAPAAQSIEASVLAGIQAYNKGDVGTAFSLLKRAADAGNSDAEVNLGTCTRAARVSPRTSRRHSASTSCQPAKAIPKA